MDKNRLHQLDKHFRAANYLSVGQIYLRSNPLLKEPLDQKNIKSRLLGHFGTSPGLNLIYTHINRLIQDTKGKFLYFAGPGHGGPALRANVFLEGSMQAFYPDLDFSVPGLLKLMKEFSWPGGVPSHVSPPTPGSIHEGGELGYSLAHAFGSVMDNPELISVCVVGDGESETGPLATSWHGIKFLNPRRDGVVLPILHLNGYKISGPTIFGRSSEKQLRSFFEGIGYEVFVVEGDVPTDVHKIFWKTLDEIYASIKKIKEGNFDGKSVPKYPMIILKTPKGWTGPKVVDGKKVEGTFRSHQVPVSNCKDNPEHLKILEDWLRSYKPEELFNDEGIPNEDVLSVIPEDELKMGMSTYANGGKRLKELKMPDFGKYEIAIKSPGETIGESTRQVGIFLRDIMKDNQDNFRVFCPDETNSNRLNHLFEVTGRMYLGEIVDGDEGLDPQGRILEILSEHMCQGWLEGYLLTGRHGLFPCYEAFALIVDSMLNQYGKWLKACDEIDWRQPIASLNYLLTSHAWRQDHNGYSHQGPGFIESVMQKKGSVARIYLPPDGNCLLSVMDHCLRSKNYINLMICGKQPMPQWLTMEKAKIHCEKGIGLFDFVSDPGEPDVVLASSGDTPTQEVVAAVQILKRFFPKLKIHMVNVVDLFRLMHKKDHPHGLTKEEFESYFTKDKPVVFCFHGHPRVIHELIFHQTDSSRFHVHGYIEEGTTTTPFDMVVLNQASRFDIAKNATRFLDLDKDSQKQFEEYVELVLEKHHKYIREEGIDLEEIRHWKWSFEKP